MECEWELFNDQYKCIHCGFVWKEKAHRNCPKLNPPKTPSLIRRSQNLGQAMVNHTLFGMQHCSVEERQSRLDICQSNQCGLFKKFSEDSPTGVCAHDDCGCYIRSNGKFMDKLSWAESKCPVGLWGPIEGKSPENPENGV